MHLISYIYAQNKMFQNIFMHKLNQNSKNCKAQCVYNVLKMTTYQKSLIGLVVCTYYSLLGVKGLTPSQHKMQDFFFFFLKKTLFIIFKPLADQTRPIRRPDHFSFIWTPFFTIQKPKLRKSNEIHVTTYRVL